MALADVDIGNMALSHVGLSSVVQSLLQPTTAEEQAVALWYPKCRDQLLQSAPWNFADTVVALAQEPIPDSSGPLLGNAAPGWRYSYQYPTDCLQPLMVTTAAGLRYGPEFWLGYWTGMIPTIPKVPFKVMESQQTAGALAIFCDLLASTGNPVYLFYIQQVTNTAIFDPLFCDALAYLIGFKAGPRLRADKEKVQFCGQMYKNSRLEALAQHLNAAQQDPERDSPSITVRW